MFRFFKQAWKDPVWSKVFAAAIIAIAASIISGFGSFWEYKFPLWGYGVFSICAMVAFFSFNAGSGKSAAKDPSMDTSEKTMLPIFQSTQAEPYELQLKEIKLYNSEEQRFFGENGRGKMSLQDGILSICRTNIEGRVMVRLIKYLNGTRKADYVRSDLSGNPNRILRFSFDCRVIGGRHQLGVVALRKDGSWITSKRFDIVNEEWEPIQDYLVGIPATEDFLIEFEDSLVERENSSIQLRNIKIGEIIN